MVNWYNSLWEKRVECGGGKRCFINRDLETCRKSIYIFLSTLAWAGIKVEWSFLIYILVST